MLATVDELTDPFCFAVAGFDAPVDFVGVRGVEVNGKANLGESQSRGVSNSAEPFLAAAVGSAHGSYDFPDVGSANEAGASTSWSGAVDDARETSGGDAFVEEGGDQRSDGCAAGVSFLV